MGKYDELVNHKLKPYTRAEEKRIKRGPPSITNAYKEAKKPRQRISDEQIAFFRLERERAAARNEGESAVPKPRSIR